MNYMNGNQIIIEEVNNNNWVNPLTIKVLTLNNYLYYLHIFLLITNIFWVHYYLEDLELFVLVGMF